MKKLSAIFFSLAWLTLTPVLAQTSAPATPASTQPPAATAPTAGTNTAATTPVTAAEVADPATAFAAGVAAYEKGDFAHARDLFAAAEKKSVSPSLEYNLGNAHYQIGDFGPAVLHYLRALSLNPQDPDTRQNLALAQQAANLTIPDPGRLDRFAAWLSGNAWTWLAMFAVWAVVYLAFLPGLFRWRGAAPWALTVVAAIIALAAGCGIWGTQRHARDGVILRADTQLKLSPTTNSSAVGVIQAGEVAQLLEEHKGYFKVQSPDGHIGWVDQDSYTPVWN